MVAVPTSCQFTPPALFATPPRSMKRNLAPLDAAVYDKSGSINCPKRDRPSAGKDMRNYVGHNVKVEIPISQTKI